MQSEDYNITVLDDFTGSIVYPNGSKAWWVNGKRHRHDGPAIEFVNGVKFWCLEGNPYEQININDYVILDLYKGKYGLMWYKLLGIYGIIEYPDIPGLIEK